MKVLRVIIIVIDILCALIVLGLGIFLGLYGYEKAFILPLVSTFIISLIFPFLSSADRIEEYIDNKKE